MHRIGDVGKIGHRGVGDRHVLQEHVWAVIVLARLAHADAGAGAVDGEAVEDDLAVEVGRIAVVGRAVVADLHADGSAEGARGAGAVAVGMARVGDLRIGEGDVGIGLVFEIDVDRLAVLAVIRRQVERWRNAAIVADIATREVLNCSQPERGAFNTQNSSMLTVAYDTKTSVRGRADIVSSTIHNRPANSHAAFV